MATTLRLLLLALAAAASPLALAATLAVLSSHFARLNGVLFATGFFLGEAIGWAAALLFGSIIGIGEGDTTIVSIFELLLGLLLLSAAGRVYRHEAAPRRQRSERTRQMLARLRGIGPITAVVAGTVLGLGVPKRLTITFVAAATIQSSDDATVRELWMVAIYMVVAAVLVWAPVLVYVVVGDRATAWLDDGQAWLTAHQRIVTLYSLLAFGGILVVDGAVQLLT